MTWSEEVHTSRLASALSAARASRSYRLHNKRVPLSPNADPLKILALMGAAAGFLLFRRHSAELSKVQWKQLPVIKQFHDLVYGSSSTKVAAGTKGKAKKQKAKTPASAPTAAAIKETLKPTATVKAKPSPSKPDAASNTATPPKLDTAASMPHHSKPGPAAAGASAPKPVTRSFSSTGGGADAAAKQAAAAKPAPAPLQESHFASFQSKPSGKPASVSTGTARPKPAAKPATVGSQRLSAGGATAPATGN